MHRFCTSASLMHAVQHFFKFSVNTMCGIPYFVLKGTAEDWESLVDGVDSFLQLPLLKEMAEYLTRFKDICMKFVTYYKGEEKDIAFLKQIYYYTSGFESGGQGDTMTGWITDLFFCDSEGNRMSKPVSAHRFPHGIARVPFTWNFHGSTHMMECYAGFDGPIVDHQLRRVETRMAFAIASQFD